ncbi:MAG: hypothetical protein KIS61_09385 [Candidatus Eremiobacteraeota bacterium]|nr:hypothetical protein [Candidatus Eremiobacteraeota bacterium]
MTADHKDQELVGQFGVVVAYLVDFLEFAEHGLGSDAYAELKQQMLDYSSWCIGSADLVASPEHIREIRDQLSRIHPAFLTMLESTVALAPPEKRAEAEELVAGAREWYQDARHNIFSRPTN